MSRNTRQASAQQDEAVDVSNNTSSRRPRGPLVDASEPSSSTAGSRRQTTANPRRRLANRVAGPGQATGDVGSDGQTLFTVRRTTAPSSSRQSGSATQTAAATVAPAGGSKKRAVAAKAKGKGKKRAVDIDDEEEEEEEQKEKPRVKRSKKGPGETSPAVTRSRAKTLGIPLQKPSN